MKDALVIKLSDKMYQAHLALLEKKSGKFPRVILEICSTYHTESTNNA